MLYLYLLYSPPPLSSCPLLLTLARSASLSKRHSRGGTAQGALQVEKIWYIASGILLYIWYTVYLWFLLYVWYAPLLRRNSSGRASSRGKIICLSNIAVRSYIFCVFGQGGMLYSLTYHDWGLTHPAWCHGTMVRVPISGAFFSSKKEKEWLQFQAFWKKCKETKDVWCWT